jgi:hypothetical protein
MTITWYGPSNVARLYGSQRLRPSVSLPDGVVIGVLLAEMGDGMGRKEAYG